MSLIKDVGERNYYGYVIIIIPQVPYMTSTPAAQTANTAVAVRVLTVAIVLIAAILTLSAGCEDLLDDSPIYPGIPAGGESEYVPVSHTFNFADREITITVPVDKTVYAAAYDAEKEVYILDDTPDDEWTQAYYYSFMDDESLEPLYDAILTEMRKIKSGLNLDSDRYAELIIAYVQSFEYYTDDERRYPKFTIETVYEDIGDCDDRSLLAAALLSREGYDVSLLLFYDDEHMALGIRLPADKAHLSYADSGYAYAETTIGHFIGWPDMVFADGTEITSDPLVIGVGNGTLTYNSIGEVEAIYSAYKRCDEITDRLLPRITAKEEELNEISGRMTKLAARANKVRFSDVAEYNRIVPEYNALVNRYNAVTEELKGYEERYNAAVDLSEYIANHPFDRKGVYKKVRNSNIF